MDICSCGGVGDVVLGLWAVVLYIWGGGCLDIW